MIDYSYIFEQYVDPKILELVIKEKICDRINSNDPDKNFKF